MRDATGFKDYKNDRLPRSQFFQGARRLLFDTRNPNVFKTFS